MSSELIAQGTEEFAHVKIAPAMRPDLILNWRGAICGLLGPLLHLGRHLAENLEHLRAADRAGTGHCPALLSSFALHGNFLGALHLALGAALYAICFCHMGATLRE